MLPMLEFMEPLGCEKRALTFSEQQSHQTLEVRVPVDTESHRCKTFQRHRDGERLPLMLLIPTENTLDVLK